MANEMLWYKAWLETRWRFMAGLLLLTLSAGTTVVSYPEVLRLMRLVPSVDTGGELGRRVVEAAELARSYRGYIWSQWYRQNFMTLWGLFALLLGSGGLVTQASGGGGLFLLSLPVTRARLVGTRVMTAIGELLALALVPSLLLVVLSPAIGERYAIGDALIHSLCLFVAGSVLFSLTFLLSSFFADLWRPLLIALCAVVTLSLVEQTVRNLPRVGLFGLMSGETYFRGGELPWLGLAASAALSAAMLYAANRNIARQDF